MAYIKNNNQDKSNIGIQTKVNKKDKKIIWIFVPLGIFLTLAILFYEYGKDTIFKPNKPDKNITEIKSNSDSNYTNYIDGLNFKKNKNYEKAIEYFDKVGEKSEYYKLANEQKNECETEIIEKPKKDKIKVSLEKKYKKLFEGRGWISDKQSKLMQYGFKEYKNEYEKANDGSNQIAMYYHKYEGGFKVHVRLQYAYSIEHHYCKVWIED